MFGLTSGITASICVCLNAIVIKKYITMFENNFWHLFFLNNLNASVLLIPVMLWFNEEEALLSYPLVISGPCPY